MRPRGGLVAETQWTVERSLARPADDIGLRVATVKTTRWVTSRWPKEHRQPKIAFYTVHRALANIEDADERLAAIKVLPEGNSRWTTDDASRRVGQQIETRSARVRGFLKGTTAEPARRSRVRDGNEPGFGLRPR